MASGTVIPELPTVSQPMPVTRAARTRARQAQPAAVRTPCGMRSSVDSVAGSTTTTCAVLAIWKYGSAGRRRGRRKRLNATHPSFRGVAASLVTALCLGGGASLLWRATARAAPKPARSGRHGAPIDSRPRGLRAAQRAFSRCWAGWPPPGCAGLVARGFPGIGGRQPARVDPAPTPGPAIKVATRHADADSSTGVLRHWRCARPASWPSGVAG